MFDTVADGRFAVTEDFPVGDSNFQGQAGLVFSSLSGGGFVAVWMGTDGWNDPGIRAQLFDEHGHEVGAEFLVNQSTAGTQSQPSVASLPAGGFVIAWAAETDYPNAFDIQAQIFDSDGVRVGDIFTVNTTLTGFQTEPQVTVLDNGNIVVAWIDGGATSFDHIRAQLFDANGTQIGEEIIVSDSSPGDKLEPDVIALSGGGFVVAWTDWGEPSGPGPHAQMFDASGDKVGSVLTLHPDIPGYQQNPELAALPNGGFVAAWSDWDNTYNETRGIWIQSFDPTGTKSGLAVKVSTLGPIGQSEPVITVLPEIGFIVVWKDGNSTSENMAGHLRGQLFDFAGNKLGEEFPVNAHLESGQWVSDAKLLDNGALLVGWTDNDPLTGGDDDVRARVLFPVEYGSVGDDTFIGNEGRDFYVGGDGNDQIYGGAEDDGLMGSAGLDEIFGEEGNDHIDGGADADEMLGGNGNDSYVVDNVGDVVTELGGEGTDEVQTELGGGDTVQQRRAAIYQLPDHVEILTGTSDQGQGLRGNSGDNIINAAAGDDYIDLTDGGSDEVYSGDGRDVLYYGSALDGSDVNDAGDEGGDTRGDLIVIQGDYSAGLTLGAEALIDIEKFRVLKAENTSFGHDGTGLFSYNITTVDANVAAGGLLVVQGGSLQVGETLTFDGSAETDGRFQIFGGRDTDTITGGSGADHLLGRAGDDTITGNGGNDRIRGGTGNDFLDGGEGADTFIYAALPNHATDPYTNAALESTSLDYDTILGFDFAEDRIDLPQAVNALEQHGTGSLSTATFDADLAAAVDDALEANAAVLFTADAGDHAGDTFLVVDADGNGAYQAHVDFVIQLEAPMGAAPGTPDFFV